MNHGNSNSFKNTLITVIIIYFSPNLRWGLFFAVSGNNFVVFTIFQDQSYIGYVNNSFTRGWLLCLKATINQKI